MPADVQDEFGSALDDVQWGDTPASSKHWKGEGAGVYELVERFDGNAYRAVYIVRFAEAVYVLHCFQKKSTQGVKTSKQDIELVSKRLKDAEVHHAQKFGGKTP
ncbi:MAG: hypothetical protein JWM80_3240 [Cyanobacteria bacterium RYN_339]|nr:hypothetical protein [Cyanobacteria bacterium RYN_339]